MYTAIETRYVNMKYNRCGKSGLMLPAISLGLWHNFGGVNNFENSRAMIYTAFNAGITHFDLANNYGPPPGSAEETFGQIINKDMRLYRDEMIISTKAGYDMWKGPYGEWGSKKYLVASLDQSLNRMGLDYVDIFYHHRPDPETPLEETMDALAGIVRQGKALYVGISNYLPEDTKKASKMLRTMGVKCLIHQPKYNMFDCSAEELFEVFDEEGMGAIVFSPLAQGLLTDKYLYGIPKDSRAAGESVFLNANSISPQHIEKAKALNELAKKREQSLAQMALAWVLHSKQITSVIIGTSNPLQIAENIDCLKNLHFSKNELSEIDLILEHSSVK